MKPQAIVYTGLCGSSAIAGAIELTNFKDPNADFDKAYVDFIANANTGNQNQTSKEALLNGVYNKRDITEKRVLGLRLGGNFDTSRGPNSDDDSVIYFGYPIRGKRDAYFSETREKLVNFTGGEFAHQDSAIADTIGVSADIGNRRVWDATRQSLARPVQDALRSQALMSSDMGDEALIESESCATDGVARHE